jgi:hypothetical protein
VDIDLQLIGALIVTYFVQTALARLLPFDYRRIGHLLILHGLSGALCATAAGFLKAALTIFNSEAMIVYFVAQLCWFLFGVWQTEAFDPKRS